MDYLFRATDFRIYYVLSYISFDVGTHLRSFKKCVAESLETIFRQTLLIQFYSKQIKIQQDNSRRSFLEALLDPTVAAEGFGARPRNFFLFYFISFFSSSRKPVSVLVWRKLIEEERVRESAHVWGRERERERKRPILQFRQVQTIGFFESTATPNLERVLNPASMKQL